MCPTEGHSCGDITICQAIRSTPNTAVAMSASRRPPRLTPRMKGSSHLRLGRRWRSPSVTAAGRRRRTGPDRQGRIVLPVNGWWRPFQCLSRKSCRDRRCRFAGIARSRHASCRSKRLLKIARAAWSRLTAVCSLPADISTLGCRTGSAPRRCREEYRSPWL